MASIMVMADQGDIFKALDKRIRASLPYSEWVKRHRSIACVGCGTTENLEVHHIPELYHVVLGYWRNYGDVEEVFRNVLAYHGNDLGDSITLCTDCHKKRHPGRSLIFTENKINSETWSVIPRLLKVDPNHSTMTPRKDAIGLIAYQTIFGIGWHLMNGHVEARMLSLHRRRFAQLLDKTPGSSFNRSFDVALHQLQAINVLDAHHRRENDVELHISKRYFDMLAENPWFVPLNDVKTDSMCVLCLRLWLGMQTKRHLYCISLDKLQGHIGMTIQHRSRAILALQKALKHIPWAKMANKESLQFTLGSRQPTPIRTLRTILDDCLQQSR